MVWPDDTIHFGRYFIPLTRETHCECWHENISDDLEHALELLNSKTVRCPCEGCTDYGHPTYTEVDRCYYSTGIPDTEHMDNCRLKEMIARLCDIDQDSPPATEVYDMPLMATSAMNTWMDDIFTMDVEEQLTRVRTVMKLVRLGKQTGEFRHQDDSEDEDGFERGSLRYIVEQWNAIDFSNKQLSDWLIRYQDGREEDEMMVRTFLTQAERCSLGAVENVKKNDYINTVIRRRVQVCKNSAASSSGSSSTGGSSGGSIGGSSSGSGKGRRRSSGNRDPRRRSKQRR